MDFIDENTVMNYYIDLIENNQIAFLDSNSKIAVGIKSLITKLKETDSIHDQILIARDLWKLLFESSMSSIDPNKGGYDQLFDYFDSFVVLKN